MVIVVMLNFPNIQNPDSAAADLVVDDITGNTKRWGREVGAASCWVENAFVPATRSSRRRALPPKRRS